jgi:hypothetical protein
MAQRRIRRDARAEQRRGGGEIQILRHAQHERFVHDDAVGITAVSHAAGNLVRRVVGERRAALQNCSRPSLQFSQVRQESTMQPTPARSPSLNFLTCAPTFTTRPTISWPGTHGYVVPCHSLRAMWTSVWQTPQKRISICTSPAVPLAPATLRRNFCPKAGTSSPRCARRKLTARFQR